MSESQQDGELRQQVSSRTGYSDERVSFPSREDHAQQFLELALSTTDLPGELHEGASEANEALTHLRFAGWVMLLGMACPVLFFVCLLPLEVDGLSYELWRLYYYSIMRLVFLIFGLHLVWLCLGQGPSLRASVVFYVCILVLDLVLSFVAPCNASTTFLAVGGQFANLLFPCLYTLCRCIIKRSLIWAAIAHVTAMMMGAIPPFVAAAYYYVVHFKGWKDSTPMLFLVLLLWGLTPPLLKPVGKPIWLRAAPAIPGIIPVLWIYYTEVAFSCFGFLVFMRSPFVAISYALSLVPLLAIQLMRGTVWAFERAPCMGTLTLHRMMLYLDAFAAVMGRVAAYTLYMCYSILGLHSPSQGLSSIRGRLFDDEPITMSASVNLYRQEEVTTSRLWTGIAGLVLVTSIYAAFSVTVPRVWKPQARASRAAKKPEVQSKPDNYTVPADGQKTPSREAWSGVSGDDSFKDVIPSREESKQSEESCRSGWLQGRTTSNASIVRQHELVLKFMVDFMLYIVGALIFVFCLTTLMTNLVHFVVDGNVSCL